MRRAATAISATGILLLLGSAAHANVTICNEFSTTIRVAFANQVNGSYAAAGWWAIKTDECQEVDFTLVGNTLYYAADSDSYRSGRGMKRDHWGNKLQLFVGSKNFKVADAEKERRGAKPEMFSSAVMTGAATANKVAITVRFKQGGTSISFTTKP